MKDESKIQLYIKTLGALRACPYQEKLRRQYHFETLNSNFRGGNTLPENLHLRDKFLIWRGSLLREGDAGVAHRTSKTP